MFPLYLYKMTILVFHSFKNSVFCLFLLIFRNPSCSLRVNSPAICVTNVFMLHPWLFTPFMVSLSSQKLLHACMLSRFTCVPLFATLWITARQAPLSRGFFRQDYQSGLLCPPPGESPGPGDWTGVSYVSCIGRRVLYRWHHLGSPRSC